MLRSLALVILMARILGPFWSIIGAMMIILGSVSALHFVWQVLLTATAP